MKTFRDLKPGDAIIWKNFSRYVDCNKIINGHHYIQEVICEDAPCIIELFNADCIAPLDSMNSSELEKLIEFQVFNYITGHHHVVNMPIKYLDKTESDRFKII